MKKTESKAVKQAPEKPDAPSWTCRSCGHDTFTVFSVLPTTYFAGELEDGTRYTHISRKRIQCGNCCQMSVKPSYDFDPSLWN